MLAQVSPQYFETIVLDLLHRMGYGTSREDLQRVGGVGDGGIDGVISLDRLGLEPDEGRTHARALPHRICLGPVDQFGPEKWTELKPAPTRTVFRSRGRNVLIAGAD
ncbi:MAG: hypothetical protein PVSMB1_13910 [Gemmatimonadaceae bacterium]